MEASLTAQDLVRPWRRATIVASLIAGVELVLLLGCAMLLVAKPLTRALRHHAEQVAVRPPKAVPVRHKAAHHKAPATAKLHARAAVDVMVLNGNGRTGVAHVAATRLQHLGYSVAGAADAKRHDYATSIVMYKPGYRGDAARLARELHMHVVGPLDGIGPKLLEGGKIVVLLGAS